MTLSPSCRLSAVALVVSLVACGGGGDGGGAGGSGSGTAGTSGTTPAPGPVATHPTTGNPTTSPDTGGSSPDAATPPATLTQAGPLQPSANKSPAPLDPATPMTMSCVEGPGYQCSGNGIHRIENNISLSRSGVHAVAMSSSDLAQPNLHKTTAFGMLPAVGGGVELRIAKDANGASSATMLLRNLGLSWDGESQRPPIIETFRTAQGRIGINGNGTLSVLTLPDPSNLAFYDYATKTVSATQANYANNVYFPRADNPSRCAPDVDPCRTNETAGFHYRMGSWRTSGREPDVLGAVRFHEDGDIHAGNGLPGSDGSVTILPGGNGVGVPFPGSKGYRDFFNWGYRYANLATWLTQDTVLIEEWASMGDEHNKNRRGIAAFGEVTPTGAVPASGSASYAGIIYGWYTDRPEREPSVFRGDAVVTVNFATREVTLAFTDARTYDDNATPVPAVFTTSAWTGAANTNVANYFTGVVNNNGLQGGISGRYFGPAPAGSASIAPEEVGGVLSLTNATNGAIVIGGFIGRKQ